jgi:hypothetical protein
MPAHWGLDTVSGDPADSIDRHTYTTRLLPAVCVRPATLCDVDDARAAVCVERKLATSTPNHGRDTASVGQDLGVDGKVDPRVGAVDVNDGNADIGVGRKGGERYVFYIGMVGRKHGVHLGL